MQVLPEDICVRFGRDLFGDGDNDISVPIHVQKEARVSVVQSHEEICVGLSGGRLLME